MNRLETRRVIAPVVAVAFVVSLVALAAFGAGCAKQEEHSATTTDSTLSATPAPPPAPDTTSTAQGTEPQKPATPPEHILVQHVLIGFQGSVQGKPITRSKADAEKLANEVLAKARAGENFDALVQAHTDDQFPGVYALANTGVTKDPTKQEYGRDEMVSGFSDAAFDLSPGYVREAAERAAANGVAGRFVVADGENLPFADGEFDAVWGNAVLHHLDMPVASGELRRVLRPNGVAVFCEPWGENPLLSFARRCLPYPKKQRTPDEQPLCRDHLAVLRQTFPQLELQGYQLLSMARRVLPPGRIVAGLDWCDDMLLSRVPALQMFCRYVVLTLRS